MKNLLIVLCLFFSTTICSSQSEKHITEYNFDFEKITLHEMLPDHWFNWGRGYNLTIDTLEKHSGKVSVLIQPSGEITPYDVVSIGDSIPVNFMGTDIELRAYLKFLNVTEGPVYLAMMATDISGTTVARVYNYEENIQATSDWAMYSIKMSLPKNASNIYIGVALNGKGQLWVDDFQFLVDGREIVR